MDLTAPSFGRFGLISPGTNFTGNRVNQELKLFVSSSAILAVPKPPVYFAADVKGVDNMGMRETVRSLRAYFIFSGLAGVFFAVSALRVSLLGVGVLGVIVGLISMGFSLAFVYVGFTLPKLLRGSASRIVVLLYASAGWTVFFFLLSLLGGPSTFGLVTLILTLLILWYLLKNVRRLAGEAQAAPSEPPPSGTY
jgi:hypothetical protein